MERLYDNKDNQTGTYLDKIRQTFYICSNSLFRFESIWRLVIKTDNICEDNLNNSTIKFQKCTYDIIFKNLNFKLYNFNSALNHIPNLSIAHTNQSEPNVPT